MVSHKVSYVVLDKDNYEDEFDFEEAVKDTIMTLLRNEYIVTINQESEEIIVIEYETEHRDWGCRFPYWLTPDEIELVEMNKEGEE